VDKQFDGQVVLAPGLTVGNLEQEPQLDGSKTVRQVVEEGVAETAKLLKDFEQISEKLGELLRGVGAPAATDLASIAYVSTATVSLAYRRADVARPLRGFGFVVPRAEERQIMAGTFSSLKFPGRAPADGVLVRAFVGRAGREETAGLPDDELVAVVRDELASIVGLRAEPLFTRIFRWPRGMPQYRVGHGPLIDRIESGIADLPGIEIAGGYLHGIGIGDCIREGAAAAGRAAASVRGEAGALSAAPSRSGPSTPSRARTDAPR
jgi:oxygen-dependent protoporphyrinogen oxidase